MYLTFMSVRVFIPGTRLRPYVKQLLITESAEAASYPVLPDTGVVMGFQYRGRLAQVEGDTALPLDAAGVTGLLDGYRLFQNTPRTSTVLVIFREGGAAHFIDQPLHELFTVSTGLANVFGEAVIRQTTERLEAAQTDAARIKVIEGLLLSRLQDPAPDLLVQEALAQLHRSKGTLRIRDLARQLHTSQSPLEKRFRSVVGASPKKFANIIRVRSMIDALQQGDVHSADYLSAFYDQAHFIKTFRKFTGQSPEAFGRQRK